MSRQSPYLKVCECGRHGKFIFPNGSKSESFFLIEEGVTILEKARLLKLIDGFEHGILSSQLERSGFMRFSDMKSDMNIMQKSLEDFCAKFADPSLN